MPFALFPSTGVYATATDLQAALAECTVDLFQNNITPGPGTVLADLMVATFTGYAQQAIATVGLPVLDPVNGGWSLVLPSNVFRVTGTVTETNTIYGAYLSLASGVVIAIIKFDAPIQMNVVGNAVPLQITLNFPI